MTTKRKPDAYARQLAAFRFDEVKHAAKVHRAEQAVIASARREHSGSDIAHYNNWGWERADCILCRHLARLDKFTRRTP